MKNFNVSMALILASVIVALPGCGSDSKPAGPGGGGNQGGALTQALEPVYAQYFGQNESTFLSLGYFGPLIIAFTSSPTRQDLHLAADPASVSCIDPALVGVVFDYDGSGYVATAQSGAPADGARFLLYEVDAAGTVNLGNEIGYLDVTCTGTAPSIALGVAAVTGGQVRLEGTLSGTYNGTSYSLTLAGSVYDTAGASLPIAGLASSPYSGTIITSGDYSTLGIEIGDISLGYSIVEGNNNDGAEAFISASKLTNNFLEWTVYAQTHADASEAIQDGYVTFNDGMDYLTVACIGGTLDSPTIIDPAVGGCTQNGSVNGSYPLGDPSDAVAVYSALRSMHDQVVDVLEACLTTVP